jgi:hypothetical protein
VLFSLIATSPFIHELYTINNKFVFQCYSFFDSLLHTHLPQLHELFKRCEVNEYNFLIHWFSSFFICDFSLDVGIIALNGFVIEGPYFLFICALSLLSLLFFETGILDDTPHVDMNSSAHCPSTFSSGLGMTVEDATSRLAFINKCSKNQIIHLINPDILIKHIQSFEKRERKFNKGFLLKDFSKYFGN